jgi:hypothetical protein
MLESFIFGADASCALLMFVGVCREAELLEVLETLVLEKNIGGLCRGGADVLVVSGFVEVLEIFFFVFVFVTDVSVCWRYF